MKTAYGFRVNGRPAVLQTEGETSLLWALRAQLDLTGTKYGCGEGLCGACVVLVDGRPVRSCTTTIKATAGKEVLTVEGLARGGRLHPLQQAFIEHGAVQCGATSAVPSAAASWCWSRSSQGSPRHRAARSIPATSTPTSSSAATAG